MKQIPDSLTNTFFSLFNSSHVVLFVGNSTSDKDLDEYIAKQNWSAIITTRTDLEFVEHFTSENRKPIEYRSRDEIRGSILSRERLPIIRLMGRDTSEPDEDDLFLQRLLQSKEGDDQKESAKDLLELLPSLLGFTNSLVVIGIGSERDLPIRNDFCRVITKKLAPGSTTFWGLGLDDGDLPEIVDAYKQLATYKSFDFFDGYRLADIIGNREQQENAALEDIPSDIEGDRLYRGQKATQISKADFVAIKRIGTLLTERVLYRIRPQGKLQQGQWFFNFLENSGLGEPQWYGYLPQSSYHVKRRYEDTLVQVVRRALNGQGIKNSEPDNLPIILSGDPASSKSVSLGALAYRIYNEKNCPVLYISNESFLNNSFGTEFENLIEALDTIQSLGEKDTRILVIWDSSSYRPIIDEAHRLLTQILNRGRRVVLVCSSYSLAGDDGKSEFYNLKSTDAYSFEECHNANWTVQKNQRYIAIRASREFTNSEIDVFWKRVESFSGIPTKIVSTMRQKLENEKNRDVFEYYYRLISLLRTQLESRLRNEQYKVAQYVKQELSLALCLRPDEVPIEETLSPIEKKFLEAGFTLDDIIASRDSGENENEIDLSSDWVEQMDLVSRCVAMFSRFKLDTPYNLIFSLIAGEVNDNPYSNQNREIFDILSNQIPWLHCGENDSGEFVFRFRTALEAEIYLQNHEVTGTDQVNLLCKIINFFGEEYERNRYIDFELSSKLQSIVRLMGPNSTYAPFYGEKSHEHQSILAKFDSLIDALSGLRERYHVPDEEADFESIIVTFIREHYGKNGWERIHPNPYDPSTRAWYEVEGYSAKDYEKRLSEIKFATDNAIYFRDDLLGTIQTSNYSERSNTLRNKADSLAIEATLCSIRYRELVSEYTKYCQMNCVSPNPEYTDTKAAQPYRETFSNLSIAIRRQPTNGFVYNTLFRAFRIMYASNEHSEQEKLQFLTQIMEFVDDCRVLGNEIESRGAHTDELSEHIVAINAIADKYDVSIDAIHERNMNTQTKESTTTSAFFDLYENLLKQQNPAAITFVCRKELQGLPNKIAPKDTTSQQKLEKTLNFMLEEGNFACIQNDSGALAMLIETAWTHYTGTRLKTPEECRSTKLNHTQWQQLNDYCMLYADMTSDQNCDPIISLLNALSTLQIHDRDRIGYTKAFEIVSQIEEGSFRGSSRLKTPFLICNESGNPVSHTAVVREIKEINKTGRAEVKGLPPRFGNNVGVHFKLYNLGSRLKMPECGDVLSGVFIGLGYMGFNLFGNKSHTNRNRVSR